MRHLYLFLTMALLLSCSAPAEEAGQESVAAEDYDAETYYEYGGEGEEVASGEAYAKEGEYVTAAASSEIPVFPLPAPDASVSMSLPASLFGDPRSLGDVSGPLQSSLAIAGYEDLGFYRVEGGFALITETERIHNDGRPFEGASRWVFEPNPIATYTDFISDFPFGFLSRLRNADPGRYRVILFLVTTVAVTESDEVIGLDSAVNWADGGADSLPRRIRERPFTDNHNISVLVYEFRRRSVGATPEFLSNGSIRASQHLSATGVMGGER